MTDIQLKLDRGFIQAVFEDFSGRGVLADGDNVVFAATTDKVGIDLTMTREQAKELSRRLAEAAAE